MFILLSDMSYFFEWENGDNVQCVVITLKIFFWYIERKLEYFDFWPYGQIRPYGFGLMVKKIRPSGFLWFGLPDSA